MAHRVKYGEERGACVVPISIEIGYLVIHR